MDKSMYILVTIFLSLFINGDTYAQTTHLSCAGTHVTFEFEGQKNLKCICSTTTATLDFLKSIGLETTERITIKLVDNISSEQNHLLIGAYNTKSKEVSLLTYAETMELAEQNKTIFGITLNEELWCSYAAHEIAHVVSSQYLSPQQKAHTAGEYISAVTQLTVLPTTTREAILNRYKDIAGYKSRAEMSELYFMFAPNQFAVKCYRHFMSLKNPKEFIDLIVSEKNGY
jgi:Family of unknown function (DUF6639)